MTISKKLALGVLLALTLVVPLAAFAQEGIVHCGTKTNAQGIVENPCNACDLITLGQRILNFVWKYAAFPVALIIVLYGGALMIGAAASPALYEKGKKTIFNGLVGLLIIFFSWIAVDTILKVFGARIATGQGIQRDGFGPWNEIKCEIRASAPLTLVPPSQPIPQPLIRPPAASDTFTSLIGIRRIVADSAGSCKDIAGSSVSAQTNINEFILRQPLTVCQPGCDGGGTCQRREDVTLNENIPKALEALGRVRPLKITSIATGSHANGSSHYAGNAVDLQPQDKSTNGYLTLYDFITSPQAAQTYGVKSAIIETNRKGAIYRSVSAVPSGETITHIHVEFTRNR